MGSEFEKEFELDEMRNDLVADFNEIVRLKFQGTHNNLYVKKNGLKFLAKWAKIFVMSLAMLTWVMPVDSDWNLQIIIALLVMGVVWGFLERARGRADKEYLQYFDRLEYELAPLTKGIKVNNGLSFPKLLYFVVSNKLRGENTNGIHRLMLEIERHVDYLNSKEEDENTWAS